MENIDNLHVRIDSLQQNITALQRTHIQAVPAILFELIALSNDVLNTNDDSMHDRLEKIYTYLKNKIDTFITPLEQ